MGAMAEVGERLEAQMSRRGEGIVCFFLSVGWRGWCLKSSLDWHHGVRLMWKHLLSVVNGIDPFWLHKTQVGVLH